MRGVRGNHVAHMAPTFNIRPTNNPLGARPNFGKNIVLDIYSARARYSAAMYVLFGTKLGPSTSPLRLPATVMGAITHGARRLFGLARISRIDGSPFRTPPGA